jgi:hypothetical protein
MMSSAVAGGRSESLRLLYLGAARGQLVQLGDTLNVQEQQRERMGDSFTAYAYLQVWLLSNEQP